MMRNNKHKVKSTYVCFSSSKDTDGAPPEQNCSSGAIVVLPKVNDSNKRLGSLKNIWRKPLVEPPKLTEMQL